MKTNRAFTVVELVVVIVVIALLATLGILAYNGVQEGAIEASMRSDLETAASALELDRKRSGEYPSTAAEVDGGRGLPASGSNELAYEGAGDYYCVFVSNPRIDFSLVRRSGETTTSVGSCFASISTLAGSTVGFQDATGEAAKFRFLGQIDVDSQGSLLVVDNGNKLVRKVTSDGVVTTFAGSSYFNAPYGIAIDSSGNVYVSDINSHCVRKLSSSGTYIGNIAPCTAGSGGAGYTDAMGTAARFNSPAGLGVDSADNIYVADSGNNRIRKISPSGVVTTLAGSGVSGYTDAMGTAARFNRPYGVAVDTGGTVYVADQNNRRIRKISPSGVVTTLAGSGVSGYADGTGTAAQMVTPSGVAIGESGVVYIADSGAHCIRKITSDAVVKTVAGTCYVLGGFVDGPGSTARFNQPQGAVVDSSGALYITDAMNYRVRKVTF